MKTVTDLGEIKKLARMFVYLDVQDTEYSPQIVKHPFTDSGMIAYRTEDGGIAQADITSDPAALELWRQEKIRQIKEARTPHEISFMITKSYSLAFLKYAAPHLSSKDLSEMLADVWVRTESPNNDPNMSKNRLVSLFKKAEPQFLMNEDEYEEFQKLDDTVTVYRGVTSHNAKNIKALSWTLNYDTADWFAHRFGEDGTVITHLIMIPKQRLMIDRWKTMWATAKIVPAKASTSKQNKTNTDGTTNGAIIYFQKGENV